MKLPQFWPCLPCRWVVVPRNGPVRCSLGHPLIRSVCGSFESLAGRFHLEIKE